MLSFYARAAEPFYTAEVAFNTAPKEGTYKTSVHIHLVTEKDGVETKEFIRHPLPWQLIRDRKSIDRKLGGWPNTRPAKPLPARCQSSAMRRKRMS
jgi:hypothetical protein